MIVEYIRYRLNEATACAAFEAAYAQAAESLRRSPHCLGYELAQCSEDAAVYILRIVWESAAAHLEGFRKSAEFLPFFQAIKPYVSQIEEMRHYTPTPIRHTP